jgi:hypothetical protein
VSTAAQEEVEDAKKSAHVTRKLAARADGKKLEQKLDDQFNTGRLFACISSRPGQCGRVSGYILEGKELEFYMKKMTKRKKVLPTLARKPLGPFLGGGGARQRALARGWWQVVATSACGRGARLVRQGGVCETAY